MNRPSVALIAAVIVMVVLAVAERERFGCAAHPDAGAVIVGAILLYGCP